MRLKFHIFESIILDLRKVYLLTKNSIFCQAEIQNDEDGTHQILFKTIGELLVKFQIFHPCYKTN